MRIALAMQALHLSVATCIAQGRVDPQDPVWPRFLRLNFQATETKQLRVWWRRRESHSCRALKTRKLFILGMPEARRLP